MRDAVTTRQLAQDWDPYKFKPHPKFVLVRIIRPDDEADGGIIVPDIKATTFGAGAAAPTMRRWCAEVVAVGSSKRWDDVQVGDVVVWGKYTNNELVHDGNTFAVMRHDDIDAVIDRNLATQRQDKRVVGAWSPDDD